jgi:hypothetical protein
MYTHMYICMFNLYLNSEFYCTDRSFHLHTILNIGAWEGAALEFEFKATCL